MFEINNEMDDEFDAAYRCDRAAAWPTPIDAIEDSECAECHKPFENEAFWDGKSDYYCYECLRLLCERWRKIGDRYARRFVRLTGRMVPYCKELEFKCTPEQYEAGQKESYTVSSYMCYARHNKTNYDILIAKLDRESVRSMVLYDSIHA